jgi:hypothetical protein
MGATWREEQTIKYISAESDQNRAFVRESRGQGDTSFNQMACEEGVRTIERAAAMVAASPSECGPC